MGDRGVLMIARRHSRRTSFTTPTRSARCGQQPEGLPRQLLPLRRQATRPLRRTCPCSSSSTPRTRLSGPTSTTTPRDWVPRLWRRDIKAGHWSPMSHPQVLAQSVARVRRLPRGKPASRALLRAQVGRPREYFGDTLVSVTGAGSGIGRETALAFAREGAEVVVSDIDEATVKETAAQIAARGGVAHAYAVDVADADAVEQFAERGERRARRARHRGQQRRSRSGRAVPRHAARGIRPGARHQLRRSRQRLPVIWPPARRPRHRRAHRQRRPRWPHTRRSSR